MLDRSGGTRPAPVVLTSSLCLMLGLSTACGPSEQPVPPPPKIRVVEVIQRDQPLTLEMAGETRGSADIPIRARVEGVLLGVHFTEGRRVVEDQLLYTIDPTPFESQVVEQEGGVAEARTLLAKAKADLDRIRPLAEMKAVSETQLDGAVAQYDAALGALQAARARQEQAEIVRGYTEIRAPGPGRIGITAAEVGEFVGRNPNPVVLNTLSLTDPIRVRFSIDERRYLRIARRLRDEEGQVAEEPEARKNLEMILADDSVHPHKGWLVATDAAVDPSTGTFTLEADFPNPEHLVLAGQFARIRAAVETLSGALLVPQRAIGELQGLFRVYVVKDDDTIELRPVEVGPRIDRLQVISEGLEPGERIAYDILRLRPGLSVTPLPIELTDEGRARERPEAAAEQSPATARTQEATGS